jgi:hypothetical protein
LNWSGDTSHREETDDDGVPLPQNSRGRRNGRGRQNGQNGGEAKLQTTVELLWVAQSHHTGDYHDNMNSEDVHEVGRVKGKLVPTFEKLHPGK